MSLLNEMLNDLAKNKPAHQARPILSANLSQTARNRKNAYALGAVGFLLVILLSFLLKQNNGIKNITLTHKNQEKPLSTSQAETIALLVSHSNTQTIEEPVNQPQASARTLPLAQWIDIEMKKASIALSQDRTKEGIQILKSVLKKEPGEIKASEQLAYVYLSSGQFDKAIQVLDRGLEYAPENPVLTTMKAKVFIGQGQSKDAIQLLKNDHPSIVTHPEFYATLALALQIQGLISEAGTYYKSLIKLDPNNGAYWLGYGISLEHDNQRTEAINAYKHANRNSVKDIGIRQQAQIRLKTLNG